MRGPTRNKPRWLTMRPPYNIMRCTVLRKIIFVHHQRRDYIIITVLSTWLIVTIELVLSTKRCTTVHALPSPPKGIYIQYYEYNHYE